VIGAKWRPIVYRVGSSDKEPYHKKDITFVKGYYPLALCALVTLGRVRIFQTNFASVAVEHHTP
jgi:hypothetical protein